MAENENNAIQEQAGCDSSASGGQCCSAGSGAGWRSWKSIVFVLILLAAGALAARSLLTNSRCGGTAASGSGPSCGGCPFSLCSKEPACTSQQEACSKDDTQLETSACPFAEGTENPSPNCPGAAGPCCGQPGL